MPGAGERVRGERAGSAAPEPPLLADVQQAVIEGAAVELGYTDRTGAPSLRVVSPLGVAATADGQRTFRVDRVRSVRRTGDPGRHRPPTGHRLLLICWRRGWSFPRQ